MKWGFRLEVKSRLASRLALYPRRQHDHNVDATRRPAGQGSSGVDLSRLLLRAVPGKQGSVRREGQSEPVFAMEESSVRRG